MRPKAFESDVPPLHLRDSDPVGCEVPGAHLGNRPEPSGNDVDWSWGPNYGKTVWFRAEQGGPWWAKKTWRVQTDIDVERFEKLYLELMTRP